MLKKILSILLCGIISIALISCENSNVAESESKEISQKEETSPKEEKVKIGDYTVTKETEADKIIIDNELCKITYKGIINSTDINGTQIKLNVVNKSQDKIIIQVGDFSINGKMHDVTCSIDILGGKEADDFISEAGIVTITDQQNSVDGTIRILNENYERLKEESIKFDL